jgi:hypothetical protein
MCKLRVKKMNWFVSLLTFGWAIGITLSPFGIYIKETYLNNKYVINHESIHWKQQVEMLIVFFYLWYGLEWFVKLFIYGKQAYYHLSFELEAYNHDDDLKYLFKRKHFSWFKYINK